MIAHETSIKVTVSNYIYPPVNAIFAVQGPLSDMNQYIIRVGGRALAGTRLYCMTDYSDKDELGSYENSVISGRYDVLVEKIYSSAASCDNNEVEQPQIQGVAPNWRFSTRLEETMISIHRPIALRDDFDDDAELKKARKKLTNHASSDVSSSSDEEESVQEEDEEKSQIVHGLEKQRILASRLWLFDDENINNSCMTNTECRPDFVQMEKDNQFCCYVANESDSLLLQEMEFLCIERK